MRVPVWTGFAVILLATGAGAPLGATQFIATDPPADLVDVPGGYVSGRTYLLRREAATAYEALRTAARRDRVALWIVSGYRSFEQQRTLHLVQIRLDGPHQATVARPGYSEHQLGTAIDFGGDDVRAITHTSFGDTPAGRWLRTRAPDFGFAVSYTTANQPMTGIANEPWHYRFVGAGVAHAVHRAALGGQ